MNQYWSWILTTVGLTGFILAGRKVWWCWYINIACQALWFTYAIVTEQWGFIVAAAAYTVVFTKNAVKWTKDHREEQARIDRLISQPIGRLTEVGQTDAGAYFKGYVDADVAATLGMYSEKTRHEAQDDRERVLIDAALAYVEERIGRGVATAQEMAKYNRLRGIDPRE